MVNRRISQDLKECALQLHDHGWNTDDICYALGVSSRSFYRWQAIFLELGTIAKPPSLLRGPHRIIVRAVMTAVKDIYKHSPDTYLNELVWWLAIHHDIIISVSGLHRNLVEAGLTRKLLHKIAVERDEILRAEY
ncbi:hypothetical protein BYT27DRAFT_7055575, partial [Phlegmacium glaucopus]